MQKISKAWPNKNLVEKLFSKNIFWVIVLLSIPAISALFVPGFFGASDEVHIAWLYEMDRAIKMGQFPPRFVPDLSYGFGYPLFNFVFPLPFYVAEVFHLLGLSLVDSIKAVFLLTVPLSGLFMYKFLKQHTSSLLALLGATIYIYTPYRATDLYVRGAFGEVFAFIFPPLIALGVTSGNVPLLALSVAGIILSHNIMAMMFIPFFIILAFLYRKNLFKNLSGMILGLLISSYFWLPAIVESKLMKYDTVFNFIDHFPTIRQLITPHFGYGASVAGPHDGMSFFMGLANLVLIACAFGFYKKLNKVSLWAMGALVISIFMMNYRSTFMWANLPLIAYFQFPWRFLSLVTFATATLVIVLDKFKFSKLLAILLIVGAVVLNFTYFKPQDFLGRVDAYYLNKYVPLPTPSKEYHQNQEEYLRLPAKTEVRPSSLSPHIHIQSTFEVVNTDEKVVDYYKYYFPGWEVRVDGNKVVSYAGKPYGQIQFTVPEGRHTIKIAFKETPFRKILNVISLLSLVVAITMIVKKRL